jgi:hypothetical protein
LVGNEGYFDVNWRNNAKATKVGPPRLGSSRYGTGHRRR